MASEISSSWELQTSEEVSLVVEVAAGVTIEVVALVPVASRVDSIVSVPDRDCLT